MVFAGRHSVMNRRDSGYPVRQSPTVVGQHRHQ